MQGKFWHLINYSQWVVSVVYFAICICPFANETDGVWTSKHQPQHYDGFN